MDPNLFDLILATVLLASVLGACMRGLGQEVFHTILFGLALVAGYMVFQFPVGVQSPDIAAGWFKNTLYFVMTAYVMTWALMHTIAPILLGHAHGAPTLRVRFWGGALNLAKVMTVIAGTSLWYAMHTPLPSPQRLEPLPQLMREGLLTAFIDRQVDGWGDWLVDNRMVERPLMPDKLKAEQEAQSKAEAAVRRQRDEVAPLQPKAPDFSPAEAARLEQQQATQTAQPTLLEPAEPAR